MKEPEEKEVCPPAAVPESEASCPGEMGGSVHFLESEAAEVAPAKVKFSSGLRLKKQGPENS